MIITIEPITWETMIPAPGEFKCFVNGCKATATKRVVIDDNGVIIRACVCGECVTLSALEIAERVLGRYKKETP